MNWFIARLSENSSRMAIGLFCGNIADILTAAADPNWRSIAAQTLLALAVVVTPETKKDITNA